MTVTRLRYCRFMAYEGPGQHCRNGLKLAGLLCMFLADMDASDLEDDR